MGICFPQSKFNLLPPHDITGTEADSLCPENFNEDGGRPSTDDCTGIVCKLLRSAGYENISVVSELRKGSEKSQVRVKEMNESKPMMRRRKLMIDIKTTVHYHRWDEDGCNLKNRPFGVRRRIGMTFTQALLRNRRSSARMLREKVQSEEDRPKVPMLRTVADCTVVVMKSRNGDGAKGVACCVSFIQTTQQWG